MKAFLGTDTIVAYQKPLVACYDKRFSKFLDVYVPIVREKYWPTIWCFESRAMTIIRSFLESSPDIKYEW